MLTATKVFNYFIEQNKPLTSKDLWERFKQIENMVGIFEILNELETDELIERQVIDNELSYEVSDHGWKIFNASIDKQKREEERSNKEYEKLQLEITDLVNKVADYDNVKQNAKYAIWIAILSGIATVVLGLLQLKYR